MVTSWDHTCANSLSTIRYRYVYRYFYRYFYLRELVEHDQVERVDDVRVVLARAAQPRGRLAQRGLARRHAARYRPLRVVVKRRGPYATRHI